MPRVFRGLFVKMFISHCLLNRNKKCAIISASGGEGMKTAVINIPARTPHLCSVLTGFVMLEKQGRLKPKINGGADLPMKGLMEVLVDGKRLAYDMLDGYNYTSEDEINAYLETCDYFFKRSFSTELNGKIFPTNSSKIYRWGFNYLTTCDGNNYFNNDPDKRLIETINLFRGRKPLKYFTYDKFEKEPDYSGEPKILFMTRLWDRSQTSEKNLDGINSMRIELVKALRKEYPNNSVSGIYDGLSARKICPELILPSGVTNRSRYLETMKSADICIASTGLHGSIGWKTGEYIAASRAIVSEKMNYEVTGDFEIGRNFLEFGSVDECMSRIDFLVKNPDKIYEMKKNNRRYYQNYLRPDVQISNSLKTAGIEL